MEGHRPGWSARRIFKRIWPLALGAACIFLILTRLDDVDLAQVTAAIGAVSPGQWLVALIATALSFAAVGQYDALFHRWLNTGVTARRAVASGAAAIALAQTLGMGLATGTLARWRMLPEITPVTALKVTNYVSFSFMAGLGLVAALTLLVPGTGALGTPLWPLAALALALAAVTLSLLQPVWLPFPLPPLRMVLRLTTLVALDVAFAALALWALLPAGSDLTFPLLLAVFTLSLGAGLLSGTPGGVGPFELCFLSLLPRSDEAGVIAAILAFRLVYYALPACLGFLAMARPRLPEPGIGAAARPSPDAITRAEALLADQTGHRLMPAADGTWVHLAETSQCLVALGDSATGGSLTPVALDALDRAASDTSRWPALYKIGARSAAMARASGWAVAPISEEAWIAPGAFTLDTPARRQLRRKLKSADRAGVTVVKATRLPLVAMEEVAAAWSARMGGERGFSMGRFCPDHLSRQQVYLAYAGNDLVAFASFHIVAAEWTLDLMRSRDDTPNGTMHALIHRAICDAATEAVPRLSLAALTLEDPHPALRKLADSSSAKGLRRFKESFAPRRERLYAAAPNRALLTLAGLDLLLRIAPPKPRRLFSRARALPADALPRQG